MLLLDVTASTKFGGKEGSTKTLEQTDLQTSADYELSKISAFEKAAMQKLEQFAEGQKALIKKQEQIKKEIEKKRA